MKTLGGFLFFPFMAAGSSRSWRSGPLTRRPGQFRPQQVHQQAVVELPVRAALVLAQHPHPAEAHLLVAADGPVVGGRRVDGEPVVPALLAQDTGPAGPPPRCRGPVPGRDRSGRCRCRRAGTSDHSPRGTRSRPGPGRRPRPRAARTRRPRPAWPPPRWPAPGRPTSRPPPARPGSRTGRARPAGLPGGAGPGCPAIPGAAAGRRRPLWSWICPLSRCRPAGPVSRPLPTSCRSGHGPGPAGEGRR